MAEEIAFENGKISNFQGLVTLILTSNRVILHNVVHHSSTYTYLTNFIEIGKHFQESQLTFCFCQVQSHATQKLVKISKIPPDKI